MTLVTLDAVLILSPSLRRLAMDYSDRLADAMDAHGGACFRLGADFPGRGDGACEPHVSLFMMAVENHEVAKVAGALADAAQTVGPVAATAVEYRHNHEGAPEVFFAKSDEFRDVQWGRKPLMVAAFLVLPIRGILFVLASNPGEVIAVQALDGIGAGLQGALFAIMVADLTRGSGRFNVAFGAATMVQGIGGTFSPALAGAIDQAFGYTTAMLSLTAIAVVALGLLVFTVPETRTPAQ